MRARLIFLLILLLATTFVFLVERSFAAEDDNWLTGFEAPPTGEGMAGGPVYALADWNGTLAAGGAFTDAGTNTLTFRLALWDGANWSDFAETVNGNVRALQEYGGDLYVGGQFTFAGPDPIQGIAVYDGADLAIVGTGLNGPVQALAVYDGDLIAGGSFTTAGGTAANNVARWNGVSWGALGNGLTGTTIVGRAPVQTLRVLNGELYAGGTFTTSGANAVQSVAKWNSAGGVWEQVGTPFNAGVFDLAYYDSTVFATGDLAIGAAPFAGAGIPVFNGLAKLEPDSTWSAFGNGLRDGASNGFGYALEVYRNELFVLGRFDSCAGKEASCIAHYDSLWGWRSAGTGFSNAIAGWDLAGWSALAWGDSMYVGGTFSNAGDKGSVVMGTWYDLTSVGVAGGHGVAGAAGDVDVADERPNDAEGRAFALGQAAPNPFTRSTQISFRLDVPAPVSVTVFDVRGRHVRTLFRETAEVSKHLLTWDGYNEKGSRVASGVYWIRLDTPTGSASQKVVLGR